MTPPRLGPVRDLTLPHPGSRTVRELLSAALSEAMSLAAQLARGTTRDPLFDAYRSTIFPALMRDKGLLASSLLFPSRLTLCRCLAYNPGSPAPTRALWARELAALLTLDTAEQRALTDTVTFVTPVRSLVSEREHRVYTFAQGTTLSFSSDCCTATSGERSATFSLSAPTAQVTELLTPVGASCTPSSAPLFASARLLLWDNNPLADVEAHPNKDGNAVDLGGHTIDDWRSSMTLAYDIVRAHLPEVADEIDLLLRHVGPVGYYPEKHLSASYLEAAGVVYMSLHPNVMTLVEALVHEFQHNKLNLLLGIDPVIENGRSPLYTSPVRPDPRPLHGVLLAVHAFQPIACLYERLIAASQSDARWQAIMADGKLNEGWLHKRLGEVARLCHEGCEVLLPNGRVTAAGRPVIDEITSLDRRFLPHVPASA